jgi:hypothetical protein
MLLFVLFCKAPLIETEFSALAFAGELKTNVAEDRRHVISVWQITRKTRTEALLCGDSSAPELLEPELPLVVANSSHSTKSTTDDLPTQEEQDVLPSLHLTLSNKINPFCDKASHRDQGKLYAICPFP